jgi:hypothetical protein
LGVALMLALPGAALAGGHGGHGGSHSSSGSSGSSHHENPGIGAASSIANRTIASVERNTYGYTDRGHSGGSTHVVATGHRHGNHEHPGPAAATRIAHHTLASLDEYTYGHDDRVIAFAPASSHSGQHPSHHDTQQGGEEGHRGERAGQVRATALARRTVASVESNTYGTGRSVWTSRTLVAAAPAVPPMSGPVE